MTRISELREKIEIERNKLNLSLDTCEDLQASYEQNVRLDKLIEEYILEMEKYQSQIAN
jgi:hypothetical protein